MPVCHLVTRSLCHATHLDLYLVPAGCFLLVYLIPDTLYQTVSTVYFTFGISSLFKAPRWWGKGIEKNIPRKRRVGWRETIPAVFRKTTIE